MAHMRTVPSAERATMTRSLPHAMTVALWGLLLLGLAALAYAWVGEASRCYQAWQGNAEPGNALVLQDTFRLDGTKYLLMRKDADGLQEGRRYPLYWCPRYDPLRLIASPASVCADGGTPRMSHWVMVKSGRTIVTERRYPTR